MAIRIFLADDHQLVRQGVRMLLESEPDFDVIGEAGDGLQTIKESVRLHPDVLIVDIVLPNLNGIEVAREVKRRLPETRIVALSMYDTEAYVVEALQAGALGYVMKKSTSEELVRAVRNVLDGQMYLSPPLELETLATYIRRAGSSPYKDRYETLTKRERQVFQLAAQGLNNPEIAERFSLSVRTVEMYRASVLKKLKMKNQTELVRYAMRLGLIE